MGKWKILLAIGAWEREVKRWGEVNRQCKTDTQNDMHIKRERKREVERKREKERKGKRERR